MILSTRDVLTSKKGLAQALGITLVGLALLVSAGVVVANYAIVSKQASQLQTLSQEITNRAEKYVGELNADLVNPQLPTIGHECSAAPAMCTRILPDKSTLIPSADGKIVLAIQGETPSLLGQTLTEYVTLVSEEVTHVTAVDENGNNVWATSDEGLRYQVWALADGDPTKIKPEDLAGLKAGDKSWVSIADRAGIDSAGALWVWGPTHVPERIAGATSFRSVVTTDDRGYAIDSTGTLWVWGKNTENQLGLGHTNPVTEPTKVTGQRMISIAVGKDNVFGITTLGKLVMAGSSQSGFSPMTGLSWQTINPDTSYKAIAASTTGAVALIDTTGKLTMVGNAYPFAPMVGGSFSSVSLGSTGGYAIGASGSLYSWGKGADGQLGLGATTSATTPTNIMPGKTFAAVAGGKTAGFAIDTSGNLYYFGLMAPLGSAGGIAPATVPTKLLPESRFRDIAALSGSESLALLDTAGNLYGWANGATPGLWPFPYMGAGDQPIRMPVPDGFPSYTWENDPILEPEEDY